MLLLFNGLLLYFKLHYDIHYVTLNYSIDHYIECAIYLQEF